MLVFMSVVVAVCGNVCCVSDVVDDSILALECLSIFSLSLALDVWIFYF